MRPPSIPAAEVLLAVAVLLLVSVTTLLCLRRAPFILVGWLWFILMLLPVIGLVQVGLQLVVDRYTYLPVIGLLIGIAWAAAEFLDRKPSSVSSSPWVTIGSVLVCCSVLLCLAINTRHQLAFWRNTKVLMNRALEIDPRNYVAHQNLGRYYARLGRTADAAIHHVRVRQLDPLLAAPQTNAPAP